MFDDIIKPKKKLNKKELLDKMFRAKWTIQKTEELQHEMDDAIIKRIEKLAKRR